MADETLNLEGRVSIDTSKAERSLNAMADSFAKMQSTTNKFNDVLDKYERRVADAAAGAKTFSTGARGTTGELTAQSAAVRDVVRQYRELQKAYGSAYAKGAVGGKDPVALGLGLADQQRKYEQDFARLLDAENKAVAAAAEKQKQARIAAQGEYAHQARVSEEELRRKQAQDFSRGLKARLEAEARTATEIARVWDRAQKENAAFDKRANIERSQQQLSGLVAQANRLGLSRGLARDFFAEFRNSKDIDKQRVYLDMLNHSAEGLANQRYALYDVSTTLTAVAAATVGLAAAATGVEASYDKAFGQVARTTQLTGGELQEMRSQLEGLSHDLPTAFGEITEVATLGAQMNIANENLESFTQTVSMFSATTGVTLNNTAMSLGRLAQLTGTSQSEISNLASSIYETGINSVATEEEILAVASQIATAGDLAGFTNTQIIGLASALASLGVAPEQSRGAIMRVFGDITEAVSSGGAELQAFATTAGMSAAEFKQQWGQNSQEVFTNYINGLSQLDKGLLDVTLKQQGFINVRDRNVLSRLANNTEVYATALHDAGAAYEANTALAEGYNTATDNLIDNATRLKNVLLDIAQSAGQSEIFNSIAKGALALAKVLENIISTPVGQFFAGLLTVLTGLVGVVSAVVAGYALLNASLLAFTVALRAQQAQTGTATLGVRALTVELLRMTAGSNGASAALFGLASAETRAATAGRVATAALRGLAVATGIGAVLVGTVYALDQFTRATKSAAEQSKAFYDSQNISTDFTEAIKADTAAYKETGEALRVVTREAEVNADAENTAKSAILEASGARQQAAAATEGETAAVQSNTAALGENVKAMAASVLANDERVQKMYQEGQAIETLGGNLSDYLNAVLSAEDGGQRYLETLEGYKVGVAATDAAMAQQIATSENLRVVNGNLQAVVNDATTSQSIFNAVMGDAQVKAQGAAEGMDILGEATGEAGQSIEDAVNGMYGSVDAAYAVEEALFKVGESLFENGADFSAYSEAGRANMDAVAAAVNAMAKSAGDDTAAFTANVAGLLAQLQSAGIDTGNELAWIGDMLNDLTGRQYGIDFNSSAARKDILSFIETSIKALQVRAQLERERIAAVNAANEQARVSASVFSSSGTPAPMRLAPAADKTELNALNQSIKAMQSLYSSAQKAATASGSVAKGSKAAGTSMQQGYDKGAAAAKKAADRTKEAADRTKDMQKEVRTLEDYANDLSGVMNRVTELMFGNQNARDSVFEILASMKDDIKEGKKAIADARAAVRGLRSDLKDARIRVQELNAELLGLRADKKVLQYQLTVAVAYGDDLRATEIRGELAEKNAEIAKTEKERADASRDVTKTIKDLAQAQKDVQAAINASTRSLTGNNKAARDNRARVQELLNAYKQQIVTAAQNGASQDQLRRLSERLSKEFAQQLKQMGYNRNEVNRYRSAFSEFSTVIKKVPRNVTVKANASTRAAQIALNEFVARNKNRSVNVKVNTPKIGSIGGGTIRPSGISVGGAGISTPRIKTNSAEANKFNALNFNAAQGPTKYIRRANGGKVDYLASGGVGGLHPGAPRGTDTVPAWLTPGEYVHNKSAVDHYGLPFMNAVNSLQFPKYLASGSGGFGGGSSSGPALVELMPRQLAQLAQMVSTQVVLDGKIVAQATNNQNRNSSIRKVN